MFNYNSTELWAKVTQSSSEVRRLAGILRHGVLCIEIAELRDAEC